MAKYLIDDKAVSVGRCVSRWHGDRGGGYQGGIKMPGMSAISGGSSGRPRLVRLGWPVTDLVCS